MKRNNKHIGNTLLPKISLFTGYVLVAMTLYSCGTEEFSRSYLDQYIETVDVEVATAKSLKPGTAVYVDFSDGMNHAYTTDISKEALRSVVNAFTGVKGETEFYSLANNTITPLAYTQTQIYNAIMSGNNYTKAMAPIEKTLETIVEKKQAALLITDFEEYNNGLIQRQNYAKDYFITWLSEGNNIIFYKIDYTEKGQPKHLYFTVFDSPESRLGSEVEKALEEYIGKGVDKFVLAGTCFSYARTTSYPSSTKGGNYHTSKGEDIVSAVIEDGSDESFKSYTLSYYSPFIQYYPIGVSWNNIVTNIQATQEEGMPAEDVYTHFLSKFYVDFDTQNGYKIKGVTANVTNFEPIMQKIIMMSDSLQKENTDFKISADLSAGKPVLDMFTASMLPVQCPTLSGNWQEICVDLDERFNGQLPAGMDNYKDLLEVDVVISDVELRKEAIENFFAWPGNTSLSESVLNALRSDKVSPKGRIIITYMIKSI